MCPTLLVYIRHIIIARVITILCTDLDVCEREGGDGARQHADQDGTSRVDEHVGARADRHASRQGRPLDVSLWRKRSV